MDGESDRILPCGHGDQGISRGDNRQQRFILGYLMQGGAPLRTRRDRDTALSIQPLKLHLSLYVWLGRRED